MIERIERGYIVPDGDPIVSLEYGHFIWEDNESGRFITKDKSVHDDIGITYSVSVDRKLNYNLPIYLEYRTQDFEALGSEVHVIRFIGVVEKGSWKAHLEGRKSILHVGSSKEHQKAYISILPHTEMEKIDLPAKTAPPMENYIL